MKLHYNLDKSFGPAGAVAGYFLIAVGVATIYQSFSGAILIVLGSFMAFSNTGASIDIDNFKIRFSNNLFGFIRLGNWQYVSPKMKIGLSNTKLVYRVYSMSNRSIEVKNSDFRIFLYNEDNKKGQAICRFKEKEDAEEELIKLSDLLGLEVKE
ncbi:hypothetical protein [Alkalitalea saponilacus]|uniref:Uncharacterized protein n=1 Tax=Alkalitalea saponilacus TaxID=889453 RepID=A0A1T5GS07_9BACT|nr:hypothetical protein [Alkalitalea saponilacus]ASB48210.1 hypothetical protein CDL62_03165 [Alkalitalea saponilacus]SKC11171.1 hypothetical protein SAMN03080601_01940 [Alkalitalea saponilacus]